MKKTKPRNNVYERLRKMAASENARKYKTDPDTLSSDKGTDLLKETLDYPMKEKEKSMKYNRPTINIVNFSIPETLDLKPRPYYNDVLNSKLKKKRTKHVILPSEMDNAPMKENPNGGEAVPEGKTVDKPSSENGRVRFWGTSGC